MCLPQTSVALGHHEHPHTPEPRGPSRRAVLAGIGAAAAAVVPAAPAWGGHDRGRGRSRHPHAAGRVVDLTHTFRAGFPVYAGAPPSRRTLVTIAADGYYAQEWTFEEHSGTHLDAPGHFAAGMRLADQLRADELIVPAAVIDVSDRAAADPDTQVTVDDVIAYERRHGRIPRGAGVFMHSGWDARVGDSAAFRNADAGGTMHFPGFGVEAVDFLLTRRDIRCIGVDTLSLDFGPSATFAVHHRLLGADRYGLENVANLGDIPPRGATAFVGLVPWEQGSGGPCRVIARW